MLPARLHITPTARPEAALIAIKAAQTATYNSAIAAVAVGIELDDESAHTTAETHALTLKSVNAVKAALNAAKTVLDNVGRVIVPTNNRANNKPNHPREG